MTDPKKEFFEIYIKATIDHIPTGEEVASEWLEKKALYGSMITRKMYCEAKGISVPTLAKYIQLYNQKHKRGH